MNATSLDQDQLALGIQQPWAELILRGLKTIEVRSQPTQVRGRIYIYASRKPSSLPAAMVAIERHALSLDDLPKGLLLGSVEVIGSRPCTAADSVAAGIPADVLAGRHAWLLATPERFPKPVPVRFLPFGVWFYPFKRKTSAKPD